MSSRRKSRDQKETLREIWKENMRAFHASQEKIKAAAQKTLRTGELK